jgi:integrase
LAQYSRKLKKGIRWWYKFDFDGKTYFSKAIYLSKSQAKKAESSKYEELSNLSQNTSDKPVLSLLEAINERLDYVKAKKTIDYYKDNKRYYSALLNKLGNIPVQSITRKEINDFLFMEATKAKEVGRDNYAVNYMLNLFKALFNYAIESHELEIRNPCIGIKPFSINKRLKYIPSEQDIEAVKNICNPQQKLLIDFISETAARINEPLKVTGKDILDDYVILYTKKSRNSNVVPRKVPRPLCLRGISLKPDERLFNSWSDTPKFLHRKVVSLNQTLWNFHNLRHRRASIWANLEKRPIYEVMSLLGHSQLSTTQKYLQMIL